jgi:hypothetical protein
MSIWKRISYDYKIIDQEMSLMFEGPNGAYEITLSPQNQSALTVRFDGEEKQWWIETKETSATGIRLCGMADWVPQILGEACWYELVVGSERLITYWGDRIVCREDLEITSRPL